MCEKSDLWISIQGINKKYPYFVAIDETFDEFISQLFDAGLIRGYYNRSKKKLFILEESWLDLLKLRAHNLSLQAKSGTECLQFSPFPYYDEVRKITFIYEEYWTTPHDILEDYSILKLIPVFTTKFINKLVKHGIVRGKINLTEPFVQVLRPAFDELLYYRNWVTQKNMLICDALKNWSSNNDRRIPE